MRCLPAAQPRPRLHRNARDARLLIASTRSSRCSAGARRNHDLEGDAGALDVRLYLPLRHWHEITAGSTSVPMAG